jgi:tellurium resistance protein TerD
MVSMTVSLTKGGNVSLEKAATQAGVDPNSLTKVAAGLGWDPRTTDGAQFDLDASAIVVGADGRVLSDKHFVFFNNLSSPEGAVTHGGDNLTGQGEGDDETITADLALLDAAGATEVVYSVSIYEAVNRGQNFGQVKNAFIRLVDANSGVELTRYDLTEDAASETLMVFAKLYKAGGVWKFRAEGSGYAAGLKGLATDYGVKV